MPFQQGEIEDDIRMLDFTQTMEGSESSGEQSRVYPARNEEPQRLLRRTGAQWTYAILSAVLFFKH